ncbi:hypothetical protein HDV06_006165 [Boothiomyces sp. JEL0866]|nr:hypothetical protein HDV06_006165 [Boothiomyces sp. JEL0866]
MTLGKGEFPLIPHSFFRPNPTFLNRKLPAGTVDPWAKRDAWRHHEFYSSTRRLKRIFPGLSIAVVAVGTFIAYDQWYYTTGPGKQEEEYWKKWAHARNERLAKEEY